ncbi:MAG: hypothetical protein IJ658_03580, partial [Kiritimatiellae bacterium]|nr:hypothetical protein [Kiritimatiellia bacterium]
SAEAVDMRKGDAVMRIGLVRTGANVLILVGLAFDADGNQTNIVTGTGRWLVEYNGENRPVRWTRPADGTVLEMVYDRMGRRVRFNADTFVYDDYLNVGTTVWDPTEPVATRPLVWLAGDGPAYYFHDGNKNVSDVVAVSGIERYSYAPFGKSEAEGELTDDNPYRFSSEVHDGILDLTCYNYRPYNLICGRWTVRDGILEDGGLNLYVAFRNVAVHNIDWLGNECYEYKSPFVVESTTKNGTWSGYSITSRLKDYSEETIKDFPLLLPVGGIIISTIRCKCTYESIGTRKRTDVIREHWQKVMWCEFKEGCGTVSYTQSIDLGWTERTVTHSHTKIFGEITLYAKPTGGGFVPVDCYVPCQSKKP